MMGNSRLHWAWFQGEILQETWDSEHLSTALVKGKLPEEILPPHLIAQSPKQLPLYFASVVPKQTAFWQNYPNAKLIALEHLPLGGIYPTMGIDRALAVLGAGETYGFPCLVIDGGTALTFPAIAGKLIVDSNLIFWGIRFARSLVSAPDWKLINYQCQSSLLFSDVVSDL